mgnify:CR=1 FL=1
MTTINLKEAKINELFSQIIFYLFVSTNRLNSIA